jgi:hypothetical protein
MTTFRICSGGVVCEALNRHTKLLHAVETSKDSMLPEPLPEPDKISLLSSDMLTTLPRIPCIAARSDVG